MRQGAIRLQRIFRVQPHDKVFDKGVIKPHKVRVIANGCCEPRVCGWVTEGPCGKGMCRISAGFPLKQDIRGWNRPVSVVTFKRIFRCVRWMRHKGFFKCCNSGDITILTVKNEIVEPLAELHGCLRYIKSEEI